MRVKHTSAQGILLLAALLLSFLGVRSCQKTRSSVLVSSSPVVVEIEGGVQNPGVYLLDGPQTTVAEALKAAGGTEGNSSSVLSETLGAQPVTNGQRIRIIRQPGGNLDVRLEQMAAGARLTLGGKLDINGASEEELSLIPQMKPQWAVAIVSRRKQSPWHKLKDLEEIPGIGPKTIEKWRGFLHATETDPDTPLRPSSSAP
jgi:DNA uptake protein ComE-like DNA-binding protein